MKNLLIAIDCSTKLKGTLIRSSLHMSYWVCILFLRSLISMTPLQSEHREPLMWRKLGAAHEEASGGFDGGSLVVRVDDRRSLLIGNL